MNTSIVIAGIVGTFAMTLFIELICLLLGKPFHVIRILARMLQLKSSTDRPTPTMFGIAVVVHYSIGILFTYGFKCCIDYELCALSYIDALIFGAIAGMIGILGWRIVFVLHPTPPQLNLPQYLTVIWLGHLVFALGQYYAYINL